MALSKWTLLLMASCIATGLRVYAQCTTIRSDWQQLRANSTLNPEQRVDKSISLQKQWLRCGQPQDTTFIRLLFFTGDQWREQYKYADAAQYYQQAVQLAVGNPANESFIAQAYYLLGSAYLYNAQAEQATDAFLLAVKKVAQRADRNNKRWGVYAELNLAYLSSSKGDYQQALTYAEIGRKWASTLQDNALMAQLLREKANALYWLAKYDEAAMNARETIRLATIAHETDMAQYYLLLGDVESKHNNVALAIKSYRTAFDYCKQTKDTALQATVLNNLGFLHYLQKNYQQAVQTYREALRVERNPFNRARLFDNLASSLWKTGRYEQALFTFQEGLAAMPNTTIEFKSIDVTRNPPAESVRFMLQREYLLTLIQDKADTWLDYAKATKNNRNRLQHALETYQVADQMIDYMRWEHTGQQSKLYWRQKTRGIYERAIETCYRLGDTERAFRFFEKSRAVMLADKLNELGARQQLTPAQIASEQTLQQAVSGHQTKLAAHKPNSPEYARAQAALLAEQDRLDAFRKRLETTNPAYYRYKYDSTVTSVADLQEYLKVNDASFVTYFEGDSALYVLGITASKATLKRQPVGDYRQTSRHYMSLLATPDSMNRKASVDRFLSLSNKLYRQLLAPLQVPEGRVIVSSDGSFIPFETLSRSASQPHYLVKEYAFSYDYSARLLLKKANTARSASFATGDFLGIAPVSFSPRLGQATLSGSDAALKPIADRFSSSTLLTYKDATRRTFQSDVSGYRVIHLFTHATADSTDQEPTLFFADSTLRLSDLGDGALPNAELVVLAACRTGVGANQRGEGVFSLARGFSALGVPSILTTLWSVQNDATYRLTDNFYKYLDQGLSKDVALQRAKQDWLTTTDGLGQLPNYWAGLILIGDSEPLDQPKRWPWIATAILLLLGIGGGAMWWRRKRAHKVMPGVARFA